LGFKIHAMNNHLRSFSIFQDILIQHVSWIPLGEKEYLNSKELYAPFRDKDIAVLEDKQTGRTSVKAVQLTGTVRVKE
jgi:hypothetical protein